MHKHRIVFMGTPPFAVPALQTLIESEAVDVVGVVTQPDRPAGRGNKLRKPAVKIAAEAADLPIYQPKSLRKRERADVIREWNPDLIIVAAFGQILRPHLLELPPLGCINIHASLLPRWRGASPIQHAILAGDTESGVCLMQMDIGLDTGAVFTCDSVAIAPDETAQTLHDKLAQIGSLLIERDLPQILRGEIKATPQNEDEMTYAPMISRRDGNIVWSQSAVEIDRLIRAMTPWPGTFTQWRDKTLKLRQATIRAVPSQLGAIGEVVKVERDVIVQTGDGGVLLEEIQLQGKRAVSAADFVNGYPDFIGSILG